LGGLYETRGRLDLAEKAYRDALAANPEFGAAYSALGWLSLRRQRMQDAQELFNRALKCNAEDPRAYHGIAELYAIRGKRQSAMDNYSKAVKYYRDPEMKNALMNQLFQEGQVPD
jgi:tetratricopeptide (TPR) repeat protein